MVVTHMHGHTPLTTLEARVRHGPPLGHMERFYRAEEDKLARLRAPPAYFLVGLYH